MTDFIHPSDGYVFIVTYGRSGSTLLQHMLNAIDGFQIRGENNNTLFPLFQAYDALQNSKQLRAMRRTQKVTGPAQPWYGGECTDPATFGADLARSFARSVLRPSPQTKVSGFKEIRIIPDEMQFQDYMDFLLAFFPKARIIFNTRNLDDVARSSWWAEEEPARVIRMLDNIERAFHHYHKDQRARSHIIRYDDYVADHSALDPLFTFLGARPTDADIARVMAMQLGHARRKQALG